MDILADILAISVTQICNLSIKLSHVPNNCKLAKLKSLYKKGSKTDPKDFRPISLSPVVSNIIKKIHDETMEYLTDNKILHRYQSWFRKNRSTGTCLSSMTDKILTGFDSALNIWYQKPQYFIKKMFLVEFSFRSAT